MFEKDLCVARAPLRIGYVGGGSDLPGGEGSTFSVAIDKFVYCIAKKRFDKKIYLTWRQKEIVDSVHDLKHDIIRECLKLKGIDSGIELLTFSDIPGVGSGLGSSAATTVATLCALNGLLNTPQPDHEIASLAASIEMVVLKRACGPQDPYISAFGGVKQFDYSKNSTVSVHKIDVTPHEKRKLEDAFFLFGPHLQKGKDGFRGRNSDDILSRFTGDSSFRTECIKLCATFQAAVRGHLWLKLGDIVQQHNELKKKHFPGYESEDVQAVGKFVKNFKLCGAGGSGFLLVPSHTVNGIEKGSLDRKRKIEKAWGPQFPYKIFNGHADIVFSTKA